MSPRLFESFEIGAEAGCAEVTLDAARLARWRGLFPGSGDAAPPGLLIALMMEGYMAATHPRPPGNVHAGLTLEFHDRPVRAGERLTLELHCTGRELRKDRRWLTLAFALRGADGAAALTGETRLIWAA
mgnify:CR=1 FL=1